MDEMLWHYTKSAVKWLWILLLFRAYEVCNGQEFTPTVTATCKAGYMAVKVTTNIPFFGAVHTKDFRTPNCLVYGNGTQSVLLDISMHAPQGSPDYCGVFTNNRTEERSVPVAIRVHRTLELADDKFYVITCGKAGFKNSKNETTLVSLKVVENGKKRQEVVYGHQYILRAELSKPDNSRGVRIKNCFAFGKGGNRSVPLINERGCPLNPRVISQFEYDEESGHSEAILYSMFRMADSSETHFQCDVSVCKGECPKLNCDGDQVMVAGLLAQQTSKDVFSENIEEGVVPASTTVFVLEPGEMANSLMDCGDESGAFHPWWLLWLCVAFALLFLAMLLINVFLCTAMTCSCARTDIIEKDASIVEDYDPYRSWHGSQYGSRFSLNGKPGYTSGGSTMNSNRSISTNSDHYAIVHSRPGSRYSPPNKLNTHPRQPASHYSGKL